MDNYFGLKLQSLRLEQRAYCPNDNNKNHLEVLVLFCATKMALQLLLWKIISAEQNHFFGSCGMPSDQSDSSAQRGARRSFVSRLAQLKIRV